MDKDTIKKGFDQLNSLADAEYHQSLTGILADPDKDRVVWRIQRLVGVLIKEPFADPSELSLPSHRTAAYRSWRLKDATEFDAVAATNPWQYKLLDNVRVKLYPSLTIYQLAEEASDETGFFGLFARTLRDYICGDEVIRKKVDDVFKRYTKWGHPPRNML